MSLSSPDVFIRELALLVRTLEDAVFTERGLPRAEVLVRSTGGVSEEPLGWHIKDRASFIRYFKYGDGRHGEAYVLWDAPLHELVKRTSAKEIGGSDDLSDLLFTLGYGLVRMRVLSHRGWFPKTRMREGAFLVKHRAHIFEGLNDLASLRQSIVLVKQLSEKYADQPHSYDLVVTIAVMIGAKKTLESDKVAEFLYVD